MKGEPSKNYGAKLGPAGKLAKAFIDSKLTPLLLVASIGVGAFALVQLPREEEPQIVVPMSDVVVRMPSASAREVEARVTKPLEHLLWEIPGVEYLYSTSSPGLSTLIVRFRVGEDEERSMVRLQQKLAAHADALPEDASRPVITPRTIDDVPVLTFTLWGERYSGYQLRRIASELKEHIERVPFVGRVAVVGGDRRVVAVELDPERLAAHRLSPLDVAGALRSANVRSLSGAVVSESQNLLIQTGHVLANAADVRGVVVGTHGQRIVRLEDVARVVDGPEEPTSYVHIGGGAAAKTGERVLRRCALPAVTISVAKHKGKNAVSVVREVARKVELLQATLIPNDVHVTVTRNYGATANDKSNELLLHMGIAVLSVALLIGFALGRRESGIVMLAIPATLALTLLVFYLYGYTLNRITLFALIFSIGILVDDAIVVVENIARHARLEQNRDRTLADIAVHAVDEVGNPTILATVTVIAAILPMALVGGLMGPYMRPIPVGASAAMVFSLLVAFVVTPWATVRLLDHRARHDDRGEGITTRVYRRVMERLLTSVRTRVFFLGSVFVLLLAASGLVWLKWVRVKMLPFDDKSELQLVVDMPEGTSLENTDRVTRAIAAIAAETPEVESWQSYVGTSAPFNFNGLVRHYDARRGSHVADIQLTLVEKSQRSAQSHAIAKRLREAISTATARFGARVKVAEVPPGPPVLQTIVAEVYGPDYARSMAIARDVERLLRRTAGVVDVDSYMEEPQWKVESIVDREKAAASGVRESDVTRTLHLLSAGEDEGLLHDERENEAVPIVVRLDKRTRAYLGRIREVRISGRNGEQVSLGELLSDRRVAEDASIYHKNLLPVVYVTADVAGAIESPVYAMLKLSPALARMRLPEGYSLSQHTASQPSRSDRYAMKWDGEWHITYEVFRDLGLAFAAVLLLIYVLNVAWFQSFRTPLVIMSAIPFSLVGILPAHAAMSAFFTATSMIGFIAGAGIVVRNSIILVDFVEQRIAEGALLERAVVDAGAVRFRPMLLTAAAVVVGAFVIVFDPIFQGLAISLMAGEVASLFLSRMTVPVVYFMMQRKYGMSRSHATPDERDDLCR